MSFIKMMRYLSKHLPVVLLPIAMLLFFSSAYADGMTLDSFSTQLAKTLQSVVVIMDDVALVAGIGFIMTSLFKFHQHKINPQQIPLSQGLALLVIGAGLTIFPYLISLVSSGLAPAGSKPVSDSNNNAAIKSIITGNQ